MDRNLIKIGLIILVGFGILYLLNSYQRQENFGNCSGDEEEKDHFVGSPSPLKEKEEEVVEEEVIVKEEKVEEVQPSEPEQVSVYDAVESDEVKQEANQHPKDCFPKDQLSAGELLPKNDNSTWSDVNPQGKGKLGDQNFLTAGYHIGVNTVGQSLRNANLQLRSEPPNPQVKVSPWLQSTIEPDVNRKPLEIGGCQ